VMALTRLPSGANLLASISTEPYCPIISPRFLKNSAESSMIYVGDVWDW
jgi:hypothetical protein